MPASTTRPPADADELEAVADLIQQVFQSEQTTSAYQAMVSMPGFDPASVPTIWDEQGPPVATVQAVPCEVSLLGEWLPAGIITMVATTEHARGRGYMRSCMEAAHRWLLDNGRPVGILYGVPAIYPKFGYRPVMPRCETHYALSPDAPDVDFRPANDNDSAVMADLFNAQERSRPGAVKRGAAPWIWRSPHGFSSLWCIERDGQARGYFRTVNDAGAGSILSVIEAACQPAWESLLLDGIHSMACERGSAQVALRLMPDHPLVSEVTRRVTSLEMHGVEQSVVPPQAGMLAILDPERVLQLLAPVIEEKLAGHPLRVSTSSGLDVQLSRGAGVTALHLDDPADIAHLLAGYPGAAALRQWGRLRAGHDALALADQVFPAAWPRWVLAPFWDE